MKRLLGKRKWLVVFVGNKPDDVIALESLIKRIEASLHINALPYIPVVLNENERELIKSVGSTLGVKGQLPEEISRTLTNRLIELKRENRVQRVAVIFARVDFSNDEVFTVAVNDSLFKTDEYQAFCWKRNFLSMSKKLMCIESRCGMCANQLEICDHSCLPRLLWVLFNENSLIKNELKQIAENDANYM
ncbi:MAG: hypothetical protein LBD23_08685 [Oscillospiraceae bacterium]|jgi:hypothetical protein|nr:hypothetical protein [Oscillospiraceae bacterium]